jgi:hypothetical protein
MNQEIEAEMISRRKALSLLGVGAAMGFTLKLGLSLSVVMLGLPVMGVGERLAVVPGVSGYLATAEARVGRPLTPVSVAGVARGTTRRCAAWVYNC